MSYILLLPGEEGGDSSFITRVATTNTLKGVSVPDDHYLISRDNLTVRQKFSLSDEILSRWITLPKTQSNKHRSRPVFFVVALDNIAWKRVIM